MGAGADGGNAAPSVTDTGAELSPNRWGGIPSATEATRLTLDYGFHITHLRAVWLKVLEHNTAGIRAYEGAGFTQVGRLRRCGYWLGDECDEIVMDAISNEFPGPSVIAT